MRSHSLRFISSETCQSVTVTKHLFSRQTTGYALNHQTTTNNPVDLIETTLAITLSDPVLDTQGSRSPLESYHNNTTNPGPAKLESTTTTILYYQEQPHHTRFVRHSRPCIRINLVECFRHPVRNQARAVCTADDPARKTVDASCYPAAGGNYPRPLEAASHGYHYLSEKPTFSGRGKVLLPIPKKVAEFSKTTNPGQWRLSFDFQKRRSWLISIVFVSSASQCQRLSTDPFGDFSTCTSARWALLPDTMLRSSYDFFSCKKIHTFTT